LYLDHAGATLPDPLQISEYSQYLSSALLGNPHSRGYLSENLNNMIDMSRKLVLDHFGADPNEYSVIFTSGATAGIKLVGESFPWSSTSLFAYPYNSHTSILGLREYAPSAYCIPSENLRNLYASSAAVTGTSSKEGINYSLLAIPGECNFSGTKYPSPLISKLLDTLSESLLESLKPSLIKSSVSPSSASASPQPISPSKWLWLLDASKLAATSSINLTENYSSDHRPDFICCSFYKIFGFPTGIGALLVKKSTAPLLRKRSTYPCSLLTTYQPSCSSLRQILWWRNSH
jgi:molybdenum cofactor sulfurtransferase